VPSGLYADECGNVIEDDVTPRICTAKSIAGCLRALYTGGKAAHGRDILNERFNVYRFAFEKVVTHKPTEKQVPDAPATGEMWILAAAEGELVGEIRLVGWRNAGIRWKWVRRSRKRADIR